MAFTIGGPAQRRVAIGGQGQNVEMDEICFRSKTLDNCVLWVRYFAYIIAFVPFSVSFGCPAATCFKSSAHFERRSVTTHEKGHLHVYQRLSAFALGEYVQPVCRRAGPAVRPPMFHPTPRGENKFGGGWSLKRDSARTNHLRNRVVATAMRGVKALGARNQSCLQSGPWVESDMNPEAGSQSCSIASCDVDGEARQT